MIKRCILSSIRHKHYAQLKINFSKREQNKQNTKREEKTKKYSLRSFCHSQQNTKLIGFPVTKICVYNLIGLS